MKTILYCLTLLILFSFPLYAGSHECQDYTSQGLDMHAEHGSTSCGNVTASSLGSSAPYGFAQDCTSETTNVNDVLIHGEWLACSSTALGGSPGCDYQFVTRCGTQSHMVSGELMVGLSGNGNFPACSHSVATGTSPESFHCTYEPPTGGVTVATAFCYCDSTSGTLVCN